jgi:hypothetical protein
MGLEENPGRLTNYIGSRQDLRLHSRELGEPQEQRDPSKGTFSNIPVKRK